MSISEKNRSIKATTVAANTQSEKTWIPTDNRFFDQASIIFILVGCLLFMLGTGIDMSTPMFPDMSSVLKACTGDKTELCGRALHDFDANAHALSKLEWWSLAADTLKAIGLTTIAAVLISSTVDNRTRSYFFKELSTKTEQLGSNVITGMFESRHPDRLFELIKSNILQRKLVRKNIDINYTLSDLNFDEEGHRLEGRKYLSVDVILSTITENINIVQGSDEGTVEMPIGLALPNPMYDELKSYVKINSFRVGDQPLTPSEIEVLNNELQEKLKDDDAVDARIKVRDCMLPFGTALTVSGSYTMVKELEDTEVFRTAEIAENIHLTVVDKSSHNLIIRARSMSQGLLHNQKSPSAQQWKLDDLSLPLQGIMVWWKQPLDGKKPTKMQSIVPNGNMVEKNG